MIEIIDEKSMRDFGSTLGSQLVGGEVIELVGDVGAGKTSLTKGIAVGLGIDQEIQSPTFTISRQYDGRNGLKLAHYDFYRIHDAGIMADELHEVIEDPKMITVIEWGGVVENVLPDKRITITFASPSANTRTLDVEGFQGDKL